MKNYYDELEVSKTASKDVIEKVYKVLAKKYHPDTTKETDKKAAEEKFKIISEAYDVLSNDEKRKKYDLDLEKSNPSISYDDYLNVIRQRDTLNNNLINLQNQLNQFKTSGTNTYNRNTQNPYYQNSFHQTRYGQPNQNFNNYQNTNINQNYSNQHSNTKKKKYYYNVATGQPVSSFEYFKYRVRNFISNIGFYILFIIILIILIKNLLSMSTF